MSAAALIGDGMLLQDRAGDYSISREEAGGSSRSILPGDASESISIDLRARELLDELLATAMEASKPGWDGYGAAPVSAATVYQALLFLSSVPVTVPSPEISAHPDGEMAFDWSTGPRHSLTVSVSPIGRVSYAFLQGYSSLHGTDDLLSGLPRPILLALNELFGSAVNSGL